MADREPGPEARAAESNLDRLEAFSDGVMAVIITITAFGLRAPAGPTLGAMTARFPGLVVYALSFAFVGIYWNNHHHLLRTATRLSGLVMWMNLLLLFWLSLIPVLTGWLAVDYRSSLPAAAYGADGFLAGISYYLLIRALIRTEGKNSLLARAVARDYKGIASVVLYAVAVAAAFVTPWIAYVIYAAVAIMWIVPEPRLVRAATGRA